MDPQLAALVALAFAINLIGTLAYAARIAGVRTRRITMSISLFNALALVSRTANAFQAPLLANRVEDGLLAGSTAGLLRDFRWLLGAASLATIVGALLVPTVQRLFTRGVSALTHRRSVARLALAACSRDGLAALRASAALPSLGRLSTRHSMTVVPSTVLVVNAAAVAVWCVGVLASLFAATLVPELRATTSNLSSIVNGFATIVLFLLVDPWLAILTDDVLEGRRSDADFRHAIVALLASRLLGTLGAQLLLVPSAALIATVARWL